MSKLAKFVQSIYSIGNRSLTVKPPLWNFVSVMKIILKEGTLVFLIQFENFKRI